MHLPCQPPSPRVPTQITVGVLKEIFFNKIIFIFKRALKPHSQFYLRWLMRKSTHSHFTGCFKTLTSVMRITILPAFFNEFGYI
jgi:hypothetical protein